jgi:hypothetical protein
MKNGASSTHKHIPKKQKNYLMEGIFSLRTQSREPSQNR